MLVVLCSLVLAAARADARVDDIHEGEQIAHPAAASDSCSYLLFVPHGYPAMPRQEWPLVIYLHRAGSLGDDLDLVKLWGSPKALASHPGAPFFVLSPEAKGSLQIGGRWKTERIERLLADLRGIYRIDASRICLTGWSIGGNETWRWAIEQPHLFAAAVPIGGHGNLNRDANLLTVCALKDMPLSAFDGDHEEITPPDRATKVVEALYRCRGAHSSLA